LTVLRSGSATDVGRVRKVNEDFALESLTLFAVADGMGGHVGGEIAARTAVDALRAGFARAPSVDGLVEAVRHANHAVWERSRAEPALRGMGTTLIAAALIDTPEGDRLVVANVGDSRAYRLRAGHLSQVSTDHSVAEELVARGELSEQEASIHPQRHILTRALGVSPDVDVDVWEFVPEEGDRFLLCSDGLTNEVADDHLEEVLVGARDPQLAAESLVALANEAGGNDNVTVVVLDVVVGERPVVAGDGADRWVTPAGAAPAVSGSGTGGVVLATAPAATALATAGGVRTAPPPPTPAAVPRPIEAAPAADATGVTSVVGRAGAPTRVIRAPDRTEHRPRPHVPRRITFRVILFVLLFGGVVYAGYAVIRWYVDSSYFVAVDHQSVVIYQGRRGGFVGIRPKIVRRYALTVDQVPSFDVAPLRNGVEEPSLKAAENYVNGLVSEPCSLEGAPTSCGSSSTVPTVPPSGTTSTSVAGLGPPPRAPSTPAALPLDLVTAGVRA